MEVLGWEPGKITQSIRKNGLYLIRNVADVTASLGEPSESISDKMGHCAFERYPSTRVGRELVEASTEVRTDI